ncbi:MAG: AIM24 family protein [Legionellales bacterium]|nr:AIM24 family protein [Legionellales bacterium]
MKSPHILPTQACEETFANITYHLDGELVPVLTVNITPEYPIFFEHHVMLWKHPSVKISLKTIRGAFKRIIAGKQVFITEATGHGQIAFSRDGAGHIFAKHLKCGEELDVREHQFLAASQNIDYSFKRVQGISNMLLGSSGFFIDTFRAEADDGILWLHGYGNVFEIELGDGEAIDVEPGSWLYKERSVKMDTIGQKLVAGLFGGSNIIINRFTGPGRLGLQSMYYSFPLAR